MNIFYRLKSKSKKTRFFASDIVEFSSLKPEFVIFQHLYSIKKKTPFKNQLPTEIQVEILQFL